MNPYPPCTWVAYRAFSIAISELYSLAIEASRLNGSPRSIFSAAR